MSSPNIRGRKSLKESSLSPPSTASPQSQPSPGSLRHNKNAKCGLECSPRLKKPSPKKNKDLEEEDFSADEENIDEDVPDRALLQNTPECLQSTEYFEYDKSPCSPDIQRSPGSPHSITSDESVTTSDESIITVRGQGESLQCNQRPSRASGSTLGSRVSGSTSTLGNKSPPRSPNLDLDEAKKHRRIQENNLTVAPIFYVFAMLCLLVFVVFIMPQITKPDTDPVEDIKNKSIQEVHKDIKLSLKELHQDMSQSKHLWTQLMAQINSVMMEEPSQPAVIVVVVPQGTQRTATCFVDKVATAIMDAFEGFQRSPGSPHNITSDNITSDESLMTSNESFVTGEHRHIMYDVKSELYGTNRSKFKWELDQALQGLSSKHVAIIHNIERIPGHAAMTFHAYCDNENAPYKRAVLLLTLEIASSYEDISEDILDITIDNQLMKLWSKDLRETDVAAIISRMANSPILIKPEPEARINRLCPKV